MGVLVGDLVGGVRCRGTCGRLGRDTGQKRRLCKIEDKGDKAVAKVGILKEDESDRFPSSFLHHYFSCKPVGPQTALSDFSVSTVSI